ncbi:SacI homology domain-containing protein [Terfezia claveryi]|nr:SacI homology domain-containing protein [Terfezia claveryi]
MSSPARRLLIVAAVEGLLLTPIPENNSSTGNTPPKSRGSTPAPSRATSPSSPQPRTVQIDYKTASVRKLLGASDEHRRREREGGLEVHGIAGVLNVSATVSYLIVITSRQQVAIVNRVPVYVVTDVALIPLSSQSFAQEAIAKAKALKARYASEDGAETDISDDEFENTEGGDHNDAPPIAAGGVGSTRSSTESDRPDTVGSKGVYGLFAQKWFSKSGWTAAKPKGSQVEKMVENPKTVTDDEPGNQDVTPTPTPAPQERRQLTDLREGTAPPPSPRLENKPAPELESFPALPLSEEERAEQSKIAEQVKGDTVHSLTPKLLHTTRLLLGSSKSFFFSYDMDITRPFSQKQQQQVKAIEKSGDAPLWINVDPFYFWNKHLLRPFISSNQHPLILPLMQGFVGQKTFYASVSSPDAGGVSEAPPQKKPFILTLISRRSTKRAGLRYLRRGIDSEGNVANYVETEQLLAIPILPSEPKSPQTFLLSEVPVDQLPWAKVYSFLQIRGSIPVYFQQSPYALRPKPVLLHSENSNRAAFEKHFNNLENRYNGEVFGINLVERGSAENIVGEKYEKYIGELNKKREEAGVGSRKVGFNWFDFHRVCRGMRFEKVSLLLDEIDDTLNNLGWTEVMEGKPGVEGKELKSVQKGIIRTNCMDCLDRTNVVQSACGRRLLERQLQKEGVDLSQDPTDWFNLVWADNGDAISKQYASTAALKGDFTRTRKRNYRGALADFGLTINRYFTNIISDFFTQAAIDFLLGNVNNRVFDEFEAEMMSKDPASEIGMWGGGEDKVGGIRANAIDISSKIVITDTEDTDDFDTTPMGKNDPGKEVLIKGWTFLTPHEENTIRTFPFEETVLLLTNKALYNCRFDFALEKVSSFERVDLRSVRELQVGTYITSTLTPAATDENANAGFVVKLVTGGEVRRVNTGTVRSRVNSNSRGDPGGEESAVSASSDTESLTTPDGPMRIIAFKALPRTSVVLHEDMKPKDKVTADAVARLAKDKDDNLDIPAKEQMKEVCLKIERAVLEALPDGGEYLARRSLKRKAESEADGTALAEVEAAVGAAAAGKEPQEMKGVLISEADIISLKEAKMKTGLLERWGYQVRRLVWA